MAFRLPNFNLLVNIWRWTNPHTNPPDVVCLGNLSPGRIVSSYGQPGFTPSVAEIQMFLRVPAHTDIRDGILNPPNGDLVEVPAGSGRYYLSTAVDDIGKGFANEHRFSVLCKGTIPWPMPYP